MEAARLNPPPDWLERMVLAAIPPAAREAVAGDLWETYQSPRQYAAEALHTVPFVVASQMRRNLNLPALILQGALIFICLGGAATLVFLPVLMLREAYQAIQRPCPRRAMREAILLSSGAMVLLFLIMSVKLPFAVRSGVDHFTWMNLFLLGMLLSPFLCMFRAGLIMQGDRCAPLAAASLPKEELARDYQTFLHRALCRNVLEAVALGSAGICGLFLGWNAVLVGLFMLAAVHLLLTTVRSVSPMCDFASLRAHYQRELARQQQLHRFLRWLWFTPVVVALHLRLAENGLATGRLAGMLDCVAAVILCFLVAALNREHGGRVQEQIGLLDRVREISAQSL